MGVRWWHTCRRICGWVLGGYSRVTGSAWCSPGLTARVDGSRTAHADDTLLRLSGRITSIVHEDAGGTVHGTAHQYVGIMKVRASVKPRCERCKIIRRKGVVLIICTNPKHKMKQG